MAEIERPGALDTPTGRVSAARGTALTIPDPNANVKTGPSLRPYQSEVIAKIAAEAAAGRRRVLLVAPTGSGKTVIAGEIVRNASEEGRRVLFLVHGRERVKQPATKLYAAGVDAGVIQAGGPPMRLGQPVQIASIQTLHARAIR